MKLIRTLGALPDLLLRFRRNRDGVALVEFAMVLPVMVLLYVGGVAVTQGIMTDRKVTLLTRSLGDIISQDTDIASAERDDIFNAARAVMVPYSFDASVLRMRVSSVRIKPSGEACVEWSLAPSGSTFVRAAGQNVNSVVPAAIRTSSGWLIMSEVEYDYKPIIGEDVTGQIGLNERMFMRPRQSAQVTSFNQPTNTACPDA